MGAEKETDHLDFISLEARNEVIEQQKDLKYAEVKAKQNDKYFSSLFNSENKIVYQFDPDQALCQGRTLKH